MRCWPPPDEGGVVGIAAAAAAFGVVGAVPTSEERRDWEGEGEGEKRSGECLPQNP